MAFISRFRGQILSWWQDTPLPGGSAGNAVFQSWHAFDPASECWSPFDGARSSGATAERDIVRDAADPLVVVTWNIDYNSALAASRISALISLILALSPAVDVILLQEVPRTALSFLFGDVRIRRDWIVSEGSAASFGPQSFISVTLMSRARFGQPGKSPDSPTLGRVWRVKYPSRFGRDALCCDIFVPSSTQPPGETTLTRIRLINVHLDSLPIQPSLRPRQVSVVASLLRCAGRGLVAGDFNPVLLQDTTLLRDNDLIDAWAELHPAEPGFTWGVDGNEPFPPNRMDKVAVLGLKVQDMEILHPGSVDQPSEGGTQGASVTEREGSVDQPVPWSDHSGLRCSVQLVKTSRTS